MATKGAITLTIVFEGMNLNRDEGVGKNVQTLKKLHRIDARYVYVSDKAIKYSIREALFTNFGWEKKIPLVTEDVIQYNLESANIITHPELDLFGYMYTTDIFTLTRTGPLGVTPAIALEPYRDDVSFNTNQGLVKRARLQDKSAEPDIRYQEDNLSLFKYSIIIDLDEVGKDLWFIPLKKGDERVEFKINEKEFKPDLKIDKDQKIQLSFKMKKSINKINLPCPKEDVRVSKDNSLVIQVDGGKITIYKNNNSYVKIFFEVEPEEKIAERIEQVIKALSWLGRKIGGNPSDLKPLLVIGGWINVKSPICHNLVYMDKEGIDPNGLKKALDYIKEKSMGEIIYSFESTHPYFKLCKEDEQINKDWKKEPPKDLEKFAKDIKEQIKSYKTENHGSITN